MTPDATALAGFSVLVTRPAHQAEALCRMIELQGGRAVRLPLLSLEPVPPSARVQKQLQEGHAADWWIFTSVNAVRYARELDRGEWPRQLAAVGPATSAALEATGRAVLAPLSAYSSEGLLELPELQQVQDRRMLIVTGEAGLQVLAPALRERGAQVEVAEVYRRVPLPYDETRVLASLRGVDSIVITSGASLDHLLRLTPPASQLGLLRKQLVVPSARVVEHATRLGFRSIQAVEQMSDAGILRILETQAQAARTP